MSKLTSLRKSLRRVLGTAVVAVLLAVGFVAPAKAIPSSMTLYIHYARSDNSYSTWFNHIWCRTAAHADTPCTITEGGDPVMNLNGIDSYGSLQIIHITSTGSAYEVGQIVHGPNASSWTKDAQSGSDRFVTLANSSTMDLWLQTGSATIATGSGQTYPVTQNDPLTPGNPATQSFVFHYDGNTTTYPKLYFGTQSKLIDASNWVNPTYYDWTTSGSSTSNGLTYSWTSGSDSFGKTITFTLPYYAGQANWSNMLVGNAALTLKDGGNPTAGSTQGNRYVQNATSGGTTNVWLLSGDTTGNATFTSNPYGATPTITSVTDTTVGSGSTGKSGDTVTLVGTNLRPTVATPARTSTPSITIGGAAATGISCSSSTTCTATVPSGTVGAQDVVVTNAAGTVTSAGGFTYAALPTITALSSASPVRGQNITVTGTNLTGATFTVGGVAATVATPNATAPVITVPTTAPVAAGTVVATTNGGSASIAVTVTKGTPTLVAPSATGINYGATLSTSTLSGGSASINGVTVAGTFAFTSPSATPTAGTASYSVTFTPTDSTGFNSNTTTTSVVVGKTTPTVNTTPDASAITYGQTLASSNLTGGVASVAGTFAFSTPSAAPATGTASYNVTFTPTDTANYNTTNFNVSVTTGKATPSVTATPTAAGITYGAALSTATLSGGSASVAGSFAYVSPSTTPNAGTYSAAVRFTPTDTTNYNTVDFNINVTVAKVTPTVTATPSPTKSPIRFGNTLSQIGLSGGSASVAGTFAYATPAATPAQGTPSVAVVFTPTDSTNYNSVNFNITITVSVAVPVIASLSPSTAAQGGLVTITGTDFDGVSGVTIGGKTATITTNPSAAPNDTSMVVRVPSDATPGANNVILTTPAGSSSGTGLTVTAATPTISSLSAASGIRGDSITITGDFYNTVTDVKFGSVSASSFTVNSVTSITATVPTGAANGAQNVTVVAAGGTSADSSFTVNKTVPTVSATPTAGGITYGQTLASSALSGGSASVAGTFAFTTPSTAPNAGTANQSVTFTPTDNTVYDTVVFNVSVVVSKATPTVSVNPSAAAITYGAALSTATLSGGTTSTTGTFAYATPAATPGAGTANQSVTFTPTDTANYNTVTGIQVSVTVNKATPTLVAPTASGLVTGQTLASSTLTGGSASSGGSSVAGSFAWTTSSTAPAIGTANQSVTFTPSDTTNYNTNTINVSVTTYGVPTISSVSPTSGLAAATLTITGTYLSSASVTVGGASAVVSANTATSITTTVPAGATIGSGNVVVTTAGGTVSSAFTVLAAPTITSLSAASVARGGTLTINGTNLGSASVTIGGTSVTITSNTASAVAVTVPTSLAFGSQSVVVTTAGGSATNSGFSVAGYSSATLTVHYNKQDFTNLNTYLHSWVQTGTGSTSGISVTGSNSTQSPETAVDSLGYDSYGGVAKITYTGSNIQQVGFLVWTQSGAFVKDAGSSADRYRTLTSANDEIWIRNYDSTVSNSDPFSSINPNPNRPTSQSVTIHYDGNTATYPKVYLATRSDLNDTAVSPYSYWVAPAYLDFTTPVTITGAGGSSTTTVGTDTFGKYVTYTFPYSANHTTWANMIVGSAGLASKDAGQVGSGNRYAALDASGNTSIWLVSGDTSSNSGNAAYTSNPYSTPVVSSLGATSGKAGDSVTITGTGLKPQAGSSPTVTIGGVSATVTSATATSVVVTIPAGLTVNSASAVVVSNAGGTSNSDKTFTLVAAPTVVSVSPTAGIRGASVALTGTNFTAASTVTIGGVSASVTYNSATSLTVVVPSGVANGALDVAVTTLGGTATSTGGFTVNKTTPTVTATPSAAAITYGQTLASATLTGGSASVSGSFAYATPSTAPVAGTANQSVVFTPTDTTTYSTVTFTVSVTTNKATPTVSTAPSASGITYGQTLADSAITGGSVSVAGSWTWQSADAVPSAGSANQTAVFTPTDSSNYNTVSRSISVTTSKATPTVTATPAAAAITYGQTLASATLTGGSASVGGTFAFATPSAAPVAGTASKSVVFTPTDSTNYNNVTFSVSVTTAKADPTVNTAPSASDISYGQTLASSNLTGDSVSVAGSWAWSDATTAPIAGSANQTAVFTPTDTSNYNTANAQVSVTTNKATPTVITAPSASDITYGQTLASSTLTGDSVSVAGSWAWSDSTIAPNAGSANQTAVFTPVDVDNYSTVSRSVSVTTAKATASVSISGLAATYTGSAQGVSVETIPSGLSVDVTYDSATASPTNVGSYAVHVVVNDSNYSGSNDDTFLISPATPDVTWPTASGIRNPAPLSSSSLTGGSATFGSTSVDGSFAWVSPSTVPASGTASYSVRFTPSSANFSAVTSDVSVTALQAYADAPNVGAATQSGGTVSADITPADGTTLSSVTVTVDGTSRTYSSAGNTYSVAVTRADAGKAVVFSATGITTGKLESFSSSNNPLTVAVATAPTVGTVSQSGLSVSADITPATDTDLTGISVTVAGQSHAFTVSGDTYTVSLTRADLGSAVVFSASASATAGDKLNSAATSSDAFTFSAAAKPTAINVSQSGFDVIASVDLATGTSIGTVTATVGTASAVVVSANSDGTYTVTLTRADANKSVVFTATATADGRAESDSTSSTATNFKVAAAPTFGTVTQDGLVVSVAVNAGAGQSVGTVTATVGGDDAAVVDNGDGTFQVTLSRSAIGKQVVFTANATKSGSADSATASTSGYTVLVAAAPTFGAITQNELVVSAKVNLGGDQSYGTVTASVAGGDAIVADYQGDGVFSITLTKAEIGKSVVFSATANQSGKAESDAVVSSGYTLLTPAPQLASLSVDFGIRGASVTVNGNYLSNGSVKVSGVSATVTSQSDTSLTFTIPAGAASGLGSVVVTTASGTSTGLDFTVADAPVITGFAAWMGKTAPYVTNRGRTFDIFGTNLAGASFTVGGSPVATVKAGDTTVRVMIPADAALGTNQAVVATTAQGGSSNTMYIDVIEHLPVITGFGTSAVRPGELITIYGTWLDNPTKVRFSVGGLISSTTGTDALLTGSGVSLTSSAITVRVPMNASSGRVQVYTSVGFIQSTDMLTVYPAPKITTMKVLSVAATGASRGQLVALTGSGFLNGSVTIGGVSAQIATSPTPVDTGITIVVPNGVTPGSNVSLIVTSKYGVPSAPLSFAVGYDKPVVTSLSVNAGKFGSTVTLNGHDFTGTTSVKFNSGKAASLASGDATITDSAITVRVPTGSISGVITVVARGGTGTSPSFTVYQPPTITVVTPAIAKAGAIVTVSGTNLDSGVFTIGGVTASPAPSTVASATTAKIVVPAGAAVSSAVNDSMFGVVALGGTTSSPFTVVAAPSIDSLGSSSVIVGNVLTINGANLLNPTSSPAVPVAVKVDGIAATVANTSTNSRLLVTVPLSVAAGSKTVSIVTSGGTVSAAVTVIPLAPVVSSLSVASQNRGLTVKLTGTNLANATVTIGGVAATIATGATATSVTVTVPAGASLGSQTVVVTTAGGSDNSKSLTVKTQLPTVSAVTQSSSAKRGVGTVTVTGSFLTGATVKVGTILVAGSAVSINSAGTSLTFTIPVTASAATAASITITTDGGTWTSTASGEKIRVTIA